MSLTVTRSRIKEKCAIPDSTYDTTIDNLIAEFVPVIEFGIDDSALSESTNLPTLNLGATELIGGEFLTQLAREPGAIERVNLNGMEISGRRLTDDANTFKLQGLARLKPFLKSTQTVLAVANKVAAE